MDVTRYCSIIALLSLALAACRPSASSPADAQAVAALRERIQTAENAGQADTMASAFADDVIVMPPNAPAINGHAAAATFLRDAFAAVTLTVQYQSQETVVSGDWAFDRGTYTSTVAPKAGGAATTEQGKYLWVLHRGPDGAWKYARITWNANGAAAGGS